MKYSSFFLSRHLLKNPNTACTFTEMNRASNTGGSCPPHSHFFVYSKKKLGIQMEKRKSFKAETVKRLSPGSNCSCFSNFRVSRIRNIFFSVNHGGRQYFLVFHAPPHFEIHFVGPDKTTFYIDLTFLSRLI